MVVSNVSGVALTTSSLFLLVVAVALNSPHLFYMSTAMIVTIIAARVQASYSVRNLVVHRKSPAEVQIGQSAVIELSVISQQKIRRPLIMLWDHLPPRLVNDSITPSTPIAPGTDQPVCSTYRFKPTRRGRYRWSKLSIIGTDALGLISSVKDYVTDTADMLVLPAPITVPFDVANAAGWGNSESEHGLSRGSGIEPRGVREYVFGDSMRYVHWRSTAKTGQMVVKEFETGASASFAFVVQNQEGTEIGEGDRTTLELMCGHLAYICSRILRQGVQVQFPVQETNLGKGTPAERERDILRILAEIEADSRATMASEVSRVQRNIMPGATVHLLLSIADPILPQAINDLRRGGHSVVCMVYDALAFLPHRERGSYESAAAHTYQDRLRSSGAFVREMSLDGLGKQ
jgi:uncharacterized protein (DUF58 family)